MKNIKMLKIIAVMVIIGFSFTSCDDGSNKNDKSAITWKTAYSETVKSIGNIAYGNGRFVAGEHLVVYSDDGISWTENFDYPQNGFKNDGGYLNYISNIEYGNKMFVASENISASFAYSENGEIWTKVETSFNNGHICYGNNKFIAGLTYLSGSFIQSADGKTWTPLPNDSIISIFTNDELKIIYADGKFVAIGSNGMIATSSDGEEWTLEVDMDFQEAYIRDIAYGGGKFVASWIKDNISVSKYSTDLKNWTDVSDNKFGSGNISALAYGGGMFVVVGSKGRYGEGGWTAYSLDGIKWTSASNAGFKDNMSIRDVVFGNGKFVITGGDNDTGQIAYSNLLE